MKAFYLFCFILFSTVFKAPADTLLFTTTREKTNDHNEFAGGTACCGCKAEHYGDLPADFPVGKVDRVTFFLSASRANSYSTKIKEGPTSLKFVLGGRAAAALSEKVPPGAGLPVTSPWFITFTFDPPADTGPGMQWKILDGDNNIYSAVWLYSSNVNMSGLPGFSKIYDCQYSRVVKASYAVSFNFVESQTAIPKPLPVVINGKVREKVYKTAVVEFEEKGNLGIEDAGTIVSEWMTTALGKTGAFEVYERLSLQKLIEEYELGVSGLMDDETVAKIGRMHGVEAIVTGSVLKFGTIISVTAKVIDVETAKIIDSADAKVKDVDSIPAEIERMAVELSIDQ
ncbi:hypothetical protein JXQ31_14215 [candidate division KSB1 bacterium]|nr:hypothetical protein [candidate division KSB1 bacterium]